MSTTQQLLLLLTLFWAFQVAASWVQYRHYRGAMGQATRRWSDGYLGVGQSRRRLRGGVVALLEVDPALRVRQLQLMGGISIFARFKPQDGVEGLTLQQLAARADAGGHAARALALRQAIAQVEAVHQRQASCAVPSQAQPGVADGQAVPQPQAA